MALLKNFWSIIALKSIASTKKYNKIEIENKSYFLVHNYIKTILKIRKIRNIKQKFDSLLLKKTLSYEIGYCVIASKAFNSFGMTETVDLIFCDLKRNVICTYTKFEPNKITTFHKNACRVYILYNGAINFLKIEIGDKLFLSKPI